MDRQEHDLRYVEARRALLDALEALEPHRGSLIVIGGQAVYLRVGNAGLPGKLYTKDGDLAINPARMGSAPEIELLMERAGFSEEFAGIWGKPTGVAGTAEAAAGVSVDLIVPESVAPRPGGKHVQLRGHRRSAVMSTRGVEGALVDADEMPLAALDPADARIVTVRVAGPAALLVAKMHKIHDRLEQAGATPGRLTDKDALDVFRLLRGTETAEVTPRFGLLLADEVSAAVTREALSWMPEVFGRRGGEGIAMLRRSVAGIASDALGREYAASCEVLARELLSAVA